MTSPRNATTTSRGRTYKWRDEIFDSVTTILNGGVPKPALTSWAARSVAEWAVANLDQVLAIAKKDPAAAIDLLRGSPWRQRDEAAANGSDVHAWAEAYVLGEPMPEPDKAIAGYAQSFRRFLDDFHPVYEMTEASVYNRRHRYAGTLDAIAAIGGRRLLIDIKTGKGVYGEVALQLAAYRHAEFIGLESGDELPLPVCDGCAVLHLRPRGYQLIPVEAGEREFRYFLYAAEVRRFVSEIGREVLGAPLGVADAVAEEVEREVADAERDAAGVDLEAEEVAS